MRPWDDPLYEQGHLTILRGNLATEGAVAKITGVKSKKITGPARVFESEEACLEAILAWEIKPGDVEYVQQTASLLTFRHPGRRLCYLLAAGGRCCGLEVP